METYGASVLVLVPAAKDPAKVFATQVKCHLEELKEMFCSEKQPEAMQRKEDSAEAILQNDLEDLSISVSVEDSMALSMKTKKSAVATETFSAFDHA